MDPSAAQQPTIWAADHPVGAILPGAAACCSGAWRWPPGPSATPKGGELAACEADLDLLLNDALARVSLDSSIRVAV
jgi:hypothetical protein